MLEESEKDRHLQKPGATSSLDGAQVISLECLTDAGIPGLDSRFQMDLRARVAVLCTLLWDHFCIGLG